MRKLIIGAGAAIFAVVSAAPALAHVTVQPNEAPTASFFRFVVRVPNERDDAATTKVEVDFPDNLAFVSFQPKEGWKYDIEMKKLDDPITVGDSRIDEVVDAVTWSGGAIGPGEFDEFGFSARVPDDPGPLEFAAFQTYDSGEVVEWTGPPDSEEPAAQVDVVALGGEEDQGQLELLANLNEQVESMDHMAATPPADEGTDWGLILGAIGAALGAIALITVLAKRT